MFLALPVASAKGRKKTSAVKLPEVMRIVELKGIVQLTIGGEVYIIKPGSDIPRLDKTSDIRVLSGRVLIRIWNQAVITADAGAWFTVAVKESGVFIQVEHGSDPIKVRVGGKTISIADSAAVRIDKASGDTIKVDVTEGRVRVTDDASGRTQTALKGEGFTTDTLVGEMFVSRAPAASHVWYRYFRWSNGWRKIP